jgi:hypothetical protein
MFAFILIGFLVKHLPLKGRELFAPRNRIEL